jgi:hypothetical protein
MLSTDIMHKIETQAMYVTGTDMSYIRYNSPHHYLLHFCIHNDHHLMLNMLSLSHQHTRARAHTPHGQHSVE